MIRNKIFNGVSIYLYAMRWKHEDQYQVQEGCLKLFLNSELSLEVCLMRITVSLSLESYHPRHQLPGDGG